MQSACVCCSSSREHEAVLDRCTSTFSVDTVVIVCLWIIVYGFTLCYLLILLQLAFWHLQAVDLTLSSKSLEGGPHSHSCSLCQSCASQEVKRNQLTRSLLVIQEIWTFFFSEPDLVFCSIRSAGLRLHVSPNFILQPRKSTSMNILFLSLCGNCSFKARSLTKML